MGSDSLLLCLVLGGDYYLSDYILLGALLSGEFLFLLCDLVLGVGGALGSLGGVVGMVFFFLGVFGLHF